VADPGPLPGIGYCETHTPLGPERSRVDAYRTVAGRGRDRFSVRGSEFVGHVAPVPSVAAAEDVVAEVTAAHPDATHTVPAYRVRAEPLREYESDAGEPGGSAGKPALNVLQSEDLENVVAIVTRYFGGTELGVGGLARAYGRGVKVAVADAGIVEREPHERFAVTLDYDDSGTVRGILEGTAADFEAAYEATVTFDVAVPASEAAALRDRIRSATSGRATIDLED
jgi:uncharacterized YigZ family protein